MGICDYTKLQSPQEDGHANTSQQSEGFAYERKYVCSLFCSKKIKDNKSKRLKELPWRHNYNVFDLGPDEWAVARCINVSGNLRIANAINF